MQSLSFEQFMSKASCSTDKPSTPRPSLELMKALVSLVTRTFCIKQVIKSQIATPKWQWSWLFGYYPFVIFFQWKLDSHHTYLMPNFCLFQIVYLRQISLIIKKAFQLLCWHNYTIVPSVDSFSSCCLRWAFLPVLTLSSGLCFFFFGGISLSSSMSSPILSRLRVLPPIPLSSEIKGNC